MCHVHHMTFIYVFFCILLVGGEFHWIVLHLFVTGYDCTQRSTFEHVKYWQDEVRRHVSMETVMLDGCVGRPTAFLGSIIYIVLWSVLPLFGGQILSCASYCLCSRGYHQIYCKSIWLQVVPLTCTIHWNPYNRKAWFHGNQRDSSIWHP